MPSCVVRSACVGGLKALAPFGQEGEMDWPKLLDGAHALFDTEDAVAP